MLGATPSDGTSRCRCTRRELMGTGSVCQCEPESRRGHRVPRGAVGCSERNRGVLPPAFNSPSVYRRSTRRSPTPRSISARCRPKNSSARCPVPTAKRDRPIAGVEFVRERPPLVPGLEGEYLVALMPLPARIQDADGSVAVDVATLLRPRQRLAKGSDEHVCTVSCGKRLPARRLQLAVLAFHLCYDTRDVCRRFRHLLREVLLHALPKRGWDRLIARRQQLDVDA